MAFDGNGTYDPIAPPDFPAVPETTIRAQQYNSQILDIALALSNCVTRDGQSPATADLPMNGNKHTLVGEATLRTQYARAQEVQDNSMNLLDSVTGTDTLTATAPLSLDSLATGMKFTFVPAEANTGNVTLNINGIGAASVLSPAGTELGVGTLQAGYMEEVRYNGTAFELISLTIPATGVSGSAVVPAGTTADRDASPLPGYLRFNTTTNKFEGRNNSGWGIVGGGATGGGADAVFIENDVAVTTDYTITSGKNAITGGPITINDGVTVTIPDGSVWTVV